MGSATCGRAAGSLEVLDVFREAVERKALTEEVRLLEVGCLGLCYAEVLVEVRGRDGRGILYGGVTPKTAAEIFESHVVEGSRSSNTPWR